MSYAKNNNGNGYAWIKRNNSDNEKAPYFKGFIRLTPELIEYINEAETDDDGNVKLEMSLWRKEDSVSGSLTIPYNAKKQQAAPVKKQTGNKAAGKKVVDPSDDF